MFTQEDRNKRQRERMELRKEKVEESVGRGSVRQEPRCLVLGGAGRWAQLAQAATPAKLKTGRLTDDESHV